MRRYEDEYDWRAREVKAATTGMGWHYAVFTALVIGVSAAVLIVAALMFVGR
jgi:hypothetical protein